MIKVLIHKKRKDTLVSENVKRLRNAVDEVIGDGEPKNVTGKPSNAFIECQEVHKIDLVLVIKSIIYSFEQ